MLLRIYGYWNPFLTQIHSDKQQFVSERDLTVTIQKCSLLQEKRQLVQQNTTLDNMEFNPREIEPQMNFYLSSLEEQVRYELKDSEARLTQSQSEGRVHLIVREDLLADVLDQLQQQREGSSWRREKELMQREVSDLKVQLAERVPSPPRESEFLKSQLGKISNRLRKAQKDLELQYFISEDLKVELEKTKGEKEALNTNVETLKTELGKERQMLMGW
ncbi:uncharacterized protein LOC114553527 [Perca flavescens]|uniref:uncharacterized protein LOC114553527 n=1 Tax=Perca flavescens TaxID=8167 RepID=UPI00106E9691|nr:uncharacterized protein LOC114553527 [Perca flavescens]